MVFDQCPGTLLEGIFSFCLQGVHLDDPCSPSISEMISVPISAERNIDMHGRTDKKATSHRYFNEVLNQSKSFNAVFDCDRSMKEQYSDCKMDRLINRTKNITLNNEVTESIYIDKKKVSVNALHISVDDDQGVDMQEHDTDEVKSGFYLCDSSDSPLHINTENTKIKSGRSSPVTSENMKSPKSKEKETKKRKFRNLIPVLRRSQSVGSEVQIVPEHALFLQYDPADENIMVSKFSRIISFFRIAGPTMLLLVIPCLLLAPPCLSQLPL